MASTIDRNGARVRARDPQARRRHGGPVVLATFASAPFDARAARLAVETAADLGAPLFVADMVEVKGGRRGARAVAHPVPPALLLGLRAIAEHAHELGVAVESRRLASLRPVDALLAFVADRRPAVVVFGADPAVLRRFRRPSRRQYRRFVAALAEQTACLLWTPLGPAPAEPVAPPPTRSAQAAARR